MSIVTVDKSIDPAVAGAVPDSVTVATPLEPAAIGLPVMVAANPAGATTLVRLYPVIPVLPVTFTATVADTDMAPLVDTLELPNTSTVLGTVYVCVAVCVTVIVPVEVICAAVHASAKANTPPDNTVAATSPRMTSRTRPSLTASLFILDATDFENRTIANRAAPFLRLFAVFHGDDFDILYCLLGAAVHTICDDLLGWCCGLGFGCFFRH